MTSARPPRGRLARALAHGALAALALSTWLLAPVHAPDGAAFARPLRLVLLDCSASVTRQRPVWPGWALGTLRAEAAAAELAGQDLVCVGFARDIVRLIGPSPAAAALARLSAARSLEELGLSTGPGADLASDLAGALALAEELAAGRSIGALRLASDGTFTGEDPEPLLRRLEADGSPRGWIALPPAELADLALTRLELPGAVEAGAPLSVRAWLACERGAALKGPIACELEIELTAAQSLAWTQNATLPEGEGGTWPVTIALGPAQKGSTQVAVRARLAARSGSGDALPENDARGGEVRAGEALEVCVLASDRLGAGAQRWARAVDALAGIDARLRSRGELGAALPSSDVLVTFDVDPRALEAGALSSVVERGGGWLAFAGLELSSGWEQEGELARLLPLDLDPGDQPPRDVVLLLDGSGSMSGSAIDAARSAALALCASAPRGERILLRWFTDRLEPEVDLRDDTTALQVPRVTGGPTDIPAVLAELGQHPARTERAALALLISDGRDQEADDDALARLRSQLAAAQVELAVFAVGPQADRDFLGRLAGEAGLREAHDPDTLPELFLREASRSRLRTGGPFEVAFALDSRSSLSSPAASPEALGLSALPAVETFVRARRRPGAEAAWLAGGSQPLLGLARRGLGCTALFTSLPIESLSDRAPWAPAWVGEEGLFEPLLRHLGRSRPDRSPRLELARGELRCTNVPAGWPAILLAREVPVGTSPGGRAAELLPHGGRGEDPRETRLAAWPWPAAEGSSVELWAPSREGGTPLAVLLLAPGRPEEFEVPPREVERRGPGARPPDTLPADAVQVRAPGPGHARSAPHPHGFRALVLALLLVAASALAWGRR